jgi:hypothetical protein
LPRAVRFNPIMGRHVGQAVDPDGPGVPRTLRAMVDFRPPEVQVDLDRPPPPEAAEPAARVRYGLLRLRGARAQVGAVALAATVGAVAGGVVVHRWEERQQRADRESTVSVNAQLLDTGASGGSSDGINASVVANLTVVNLGPLPIRVESVEADRDGLEFRNTSPEAMVRPGFRTVAVWVTYACRNGPISSDPLPVRMRVRTVDDQLHPVDIRMEMGDATWPRLLESMCDPSTADGS